MSTLSDSDEVTATEEQKDGTLPMEAKLLKTDILSKASLETLYTSPVEIILSQATVHDHQSPSTTPGALPPSPPSPPSPSSTEYLDEFSSCGALLLSQKLRNLELQSRESSEMDPSCLLTPPNTPHTCVQMALGTWRGGHKERTLTFQKAWYEKYVSMGTEGVLCFHCSKYFKTGKPAQAKSIDPAFVSTGFQNWKKALEKFSMHEKSEGHKVAVTTAAYETRPVTTQLSSAVSTQQAENRASLLKIIGAEMFLARQGLAFRGHEHHQGNLDQLLKYKAEGDQAFTRWLSAKQWTIWIHSYCQPLDEDRHNQIAKTKKEISLFLPIHLPCRHMSGSSA
ncbi:uncharacterized protein LOC144461936 isoform X1 [Epinephelus lanceolatus]